MAGTYVTKDSNVDLNSLISSQSPLTWLTPVHMLQLVDERRAILYEGDAGEGILIYDNPDGRGSKVVITSEHHRSIAKTIGLLLDIELEGNANGCRR